mmetsp:Transcript_11667/g.33694  ORF Transcript_11667/g.33694 Transcript_11667/m.33694 type:complete len:209 (-) Transcript_11667:412-1038(-)
MVLPVVGQGLVEGAVLVSRHLVGLAHPDRLLTVQGLPLVGHLLDLLRLLLLLATLLALLGHVLDLGGLLLLALLLLRTLAFLLLVLILDLLLRRGLDEELDREANELGVLLDQILQPALLKVLLHVLLEVEGDAGATANLHLGFVLVPGHGELATGGRAPGVLLIVVVLGGDHHLVSHQVGGVETHAELANHGDVRTGGESFHECLGA